MSAGTSIDSHVTMPGTRPQVSLGEASSEVEEHVESHDDRPLDSQKDIRLNSGVTKTKEQGGTLAQKTNSLSDIPSGSAESGSHDVAASDDVKAVVKSMGMINGPVAEQGELDVEARGEPKPQSFQPYSGADMEYLKELSREIPASKGWAAGAPLANPEDKQKAGNGLSPLLSGLYELLDTTMRDSPLEVRQA